MSELKMIDSSTDISKLHLIPMKWDVEYHGTAYQVFAIQGYVHTIGGKYGENNYWCCKRYEEPTNRNLIPFNGDPCNWGILIENNTSYHYHDMGDYREIRSSYNCVITRNNKHFYSFGARDLCWAFSHAHDLLVTKIQEGPIPYNSYDYQDHISGRVIYYWGKRAVIQTPQDPSGCVMIHVDGEPETRRIDIISSNGIRWYE